MTAYIIRRLLFMVPTLFGIMLVTFVVVQFAPGGPVQNVIAKLSGADTGATSRISGSPGGDLGARGQPGDPEMREVAPVSDPESWAMTRSTGPPGANCTTTNETNMMPNSVGTMNSRRRMM